MKDLIRNCIYQGKIYIGTLVFFILESSLSIDISYIFFHTAFSGISNMEIEKK